MTSKMSGLPGSHPHRPARSITVSPLRMTVLSARPGREMDDLVAGLLALGSTRPLRLPRINAIPVAMCSGNSPMTVAGTAADLPHAPKGNPQRKRGAHCIPFEPPRGGPPGRDDRRGLWPSQAASAERRRSPAPAAFEQQCEKEGHAQKGRDHTELELIRGRNDADQNIGRGEKKPAGKG